MDIEEEEESDSEKNECNLEDNIDNNELKFEDNKALLFGKDNISNHKDIENLFNVEIKKKKRNDLTDFDIVNDMNIKKIIKKK